MTRFLPRAELEAMGFQRLGEHVLIDQLAVVINPGRVSLADHCRIDAFSLISAGEEGVAIGRYVHLGVGSQIFGDGGAVVLEDFSGLSARATLFTCSVSGRPDCRDMMLNPTVPLEFRSLKQGPVVLRRHSGVGCGSVVLPGVEMGFGSGAGALTLVRKSLAEGVVICGNPAQMLLRRDRDTLERLEEQFFASQR